MCAPVVGVLTAASGAMSAIGQHQAASAAAARQNAVNQQQYQNQLKIAERNDLIKKNKHAADLKSHAKAVNEAIMQKNLNQMEANRASQAATRKKLEGFTEAAFEKQNNIAAAIKAQGKVLSTGNSGQSFLLSTKESERNLGFATAAIEQSLFDQELAFGNEMLGIKNKQYGSDNEVNSSIPMVPTSPAASFIPNKPPIVKGPSGLALAGSLLGATMGGIDAGMDWSSSYGKSQQSGTQTGGGN